MGSPEPSGPGVDVPPAELARAAAVADLCAQDLAACLRRWGADAQAASGAAPEPSTGQLLELAGETFGRCLDDHSWAMTDLASALRGSERAFRATDDAGAGAIGRALDPGAPR